METKIEVWRDIEGYEGYYQVSNFGRVRSVERVVYQKSKKGKLFLRPVREKIISQRLNTNGYLLVSMTKESSMRSFSVHRIVAKAFVRGYREDLQVNHIDEDKLNNCAWNLEWVTCRENVNYGTNSTRKMMNNPRRKPVIQMTMDGKIIKRWVSMSEAYRQTGISYKNISAACIGIYKQTHGYRWKFADE